MTALMIYLIMIPDKITDISPTISVACSFATIISTIGLIIKNGIIAGEKEKNINFQEDEFTKFLGKCFNRTLKVSLTIIFINTALYILLPSSNTAILMYIIPKIEDSQFVKEDFPELYDLGIEALKDELKSRVENISDNILESNVQ